MYSIKLNRSQLIGHFKHWWFIIYIIINLQQGHTTLNIFFQVRAVWFSGRFTTKQLIIDQLIHTYTCLGDRRVMNAEPGVSRSFTPLLTSCLHTHFQHEVQWVGDSAGSHDQWASALVALYPKAAERKKRKNVVFITRPISPQWLWKFGQSICVWLEGVSHDLGAGRRVAIHL